MASHTHPSLLNALANKLERNNVRITHLDMREGLQLFDTKYQHLKEPPDVDGKIPDLRGVDQQNVIHIGEAETSPSDPHTESQLLTFACRVMSNTNTPVPLHVIVSSEHTEAMKNTIRRIGLEGKMIDGQIRLYHM